MRAIALFCAAGLLEVGGGYLVWTWLREHRSPIIGIVGMALLALYGFVPVFQSNEHPFGRIYAAYGAVFIVISALWGWGIDRNPPDARDWIGIIVCLLGATVMMWPRGSLS